MKIIKRIAALLVLVAIVGLIAFKLKSNKQTVEANTYRHDPNLAVLVEAEAVQLRSIGGAKRYTGIFEPLREGKIMSEAQGKITWLGISEGDFVQTGQTVARLDDTLLRLQVEALDVQIEGHRNDLRRYEVLTPAEAVPGVQLEKTRLALKAAEVQRKTLLEQISRTAIRAPFPGIVTLKMVETGTVIAPGVPLAQLTDISSLKLTVSVPEIELAHFRKGQNLNAEADALPGKTLAGLVSLVGSRGDAAHNFAVQVLVKNPQPDALKAGMYGSVVFAEKAAGQVLAVPLSALTGSAKSAQVFVVEDGKARLREVRLGASGGQYAQVLEGLQAGEMVVTGGLVNLEEGTPVRF